MVQNIKEIRKHYTKPYNVDKELRPDLFSTSALNPYPGHTASSRVQMFASSHLSQRLNILEPTLRYCQTGMEYEFGKYTLNIKMPVDARIITIIKRYLETADDSTIRYNPQDIVIYENVETGEVGVLDIPRYQSYHQQFGFEYVTTDDYEKITPRGFVAKDTVIVDAPSKQKNGGYMLGREVNVAFMTHPAIAEDGILISSDVLHKFAYKTYETRVVEWGAKKFPLNLYGTAFNFKAFPDIGEYIRDDGLFMGFRQDDKNLGPVDQSIYDMMVPDHIFDKLTYAAGPGGRVVDIRVDCGEDYRVNFLEGTDAQIHKYVNATNEFYKKIWSEYKRLQRERGPHLRITEEFSRLLIEVQAAIIPLSNPKLNKLHRKSPLDDVRVEFVIEYINVPHDGAKLTDLLGGLTK